MTAAIAESPKATVTQNTRPTPLHAMAPHVLYAPSASTVYEVPVDLIVRSETNRQPQLDDDFVESIRRGVDSPVLVRPIKATQEHVEQWRRIDSPAVAIGQTIYKLVYGERRWAASKKAGKKTIPGIVRELTDTQALEIQIRENEDRKDYDAMDRAAAYAHLRAQYMLDHKGEKGFTEEKCCDLISQACKNDKIKGRTVQQIIALGKLSRECQEALRKHEMEQSHAYELCRRPEAEQLELLKWLRRETLHGQGDVPSVRRLKREISAIDIAAEEARRQKKLFKDPQPGTSTTRVPTVGEASKPPQTLAKPGDQAAQLIHRLHTNTLTEEDEKKLHPPKPLSPAQIKKDEAAARESREFKRRRDEHERNERIEKEYRGLFFATLAKKARIDSRLLNYVIPSMIFEVWESELPIESCAQEVLQWPAPKDAHAYSYSEILEHSKKHARKFSGSLLAAMVLTLYLNENEIVKIARSMGIDPKKLRKKAMAAVKEEQKKK